MMSKIDFGWNEYTLEELGLPPADQILTGVKEDRKYSRTY